MATDIGSATDVRRILGRDSDELIDSEVEPFINEAIRWIKATYYREYMLDRFYVTFNPNNGSVSRIYNTYFDIASDSATTIYVNANEKTATTDYTISGNTITFTSSVTLSAGDKILVYYQPDFFDDFANYLAAQRILGRSSVDLPDGNARSGRMDFVNEQVEMYKKMIRNKPHVAEYREHAEDIQIY